MKILHIIDSGGLYGAEMMLLNLFQEQVRLGLDPTIASIGEMGIDEKPLEAEALKRGFKVEKFRMRPGPNLPGALRILRFAHHEKFDLMHLHGYKGNILFGLMPRAFRKIPLVSTLHGWTSADSLSKMKLYEWLDSKSLKYIDAVVAVNRRMLSHPKLRDLRLANLRVVNNGITPLEFSQGIELDQKIVDFCRGGFAVGSVGRLSREKGFHHLIDAFSELRRLAPETRLVIIGEGEERPSLEARIAQKGLGKHVLLPGYRAKARRYLPLFGIFVLPSLTEGLPLSLLEAMHYGLPIVASRVGGVPEVLENGNAGILVEPDDGRAIANALWELYQKPEYGTALGMKARQIVIRNYSSEKMALEYCEIYKSLNPSTTVREQKFSGVWLKEIVKKLFLKLPFFISVVSFLTRKSPRVFMYHRFSEGLDGVEGRVDAETFDWELSQLKNRWKVITLGEYLELRRDGTDLPSYLVILTVDDGYGDFYRVAYPRLKKHGLTATFFPTIGFVDGGWLWWDRIHYAFEHSPREGLSLEFLGEKFKVDLRDGDRKIACKTFVDYCLTLDDDTKWTLISRLEKELEVALPPSPPEEYAAVGWGQLREMSKNRIEIGSHTMSHPVLSRVSDQSFAEEIETSKKRIETKLDQEVFSFCYPNGGPDDLNEEICRFVEKAGYRGAVVAYDGPHEPFDPCRIPRMAAGRDKTDFLWKLCGMERLVLDIKNRLKG